MERIFILLITIGITWSNELNAQKHNTFEIDEILPSGKRYYVKDSTQYSPEFIQGLREINTVYDSLKLIQDDLILSKTEIYKLPNDLPLNKLVIYKSESGGKSYELFLTRINFTDINYEFRFNEQSLKKGRVLLNASFFFGEETSEDEEIGGIYSLTQYFDKKNGWTCIEVENGTGNRVKLSFDFDKNINRMTIPTLRKK
jgi:hypothetical protein